MRLGRQRIAIVLLSFSIVVFAVVGRLVGGEEVREKTYDDLATFTEVLHLVNSSYVDPVDEDRLMYGAFRGMLGSLDPNSGWLSANEVKEIMAEDAPPRLGSGIETAKRGGYAHVVGVHRGGPADRAGIKEGEYVRTIAGVSTRDMSLFQIRRSLTGPRGAVLKLNLFGEGEGREVEITLEPYSPTPLTATRRDSVLIIKLHLLEKETIDALSRVLVAPPEGVKQVLLDLRNTVGGGREEGVGLADLFLESGTIVGLEQRGQEPETIAARPGQAWTGPLAVLVNRLSASAAEITVAALKANKRAEVLGEPTYGDATLQKLIHLPDASAVILSVGRYVAPGGGSWAGEGVQPDVVISSQDQESDEDAEEEPVPRESGGPDAQLERALEHLRQGGVPAKVAALIRALGAGLILILAAGPTLAAPAASGEAARLPETLRQAPAPGATAYSAYALAKIAQRQRDFASALTLLQEAAKADPKSATVRAELAWTYLTVRDYPAAEEAAQAAIEIDPAHALAHKVMAQLFYSRARRGIEPETNRSRAMAELEASIGEGEIEDPEVLLTLGRFYFESGELDKAVQVLSRFSEAQPGAGVTPLFLLARTYLQMERYDEAERTLRQILEATPDSVQALEMLVRVHQARDEYAESLPHLERILEIQGGDASLFRQIGDACFRTGDFARAAEMFGAALKEEPTSAYTRYYLALALERQDRTREAREHMATLLEQEPTNTDFLFRMGRLEEREGNIEGAVKRYDALLKQIETLPASDPRRVEVPAVCARATLLLLERQKPDEAVKRIEACLEGSEEPSDMLHLLFIRALALAGSHGKALAEVRRGKEVFPADLRFPILEGEVLLHQGKDAEADALFEEILSRPPAARGDEPFTPRILISDAYFNAGAQAERRDDEARSEQLLRRAIELNPNNGPALNYLGYTWADANRNLEESLELLRRAVALDPENGAYQDSLGWVYYRLGRHEEARAHLLKAVKMADRDATIMDHLGDVESAAGRPESAVWHWERALELGVADAEEIQRKIKTVRAADGGK